jgi:hypothetical protein
MSFLDSGFLRSFNARFGYFIPLLLRIIFSAVVINQTQKKCFYFTLKYQKKLCLAAFFLVFTQSFVFSRDVNYTIKFYNSLEDDGILYATNETHSIALDIDATPPTLTFVSITSDSNSSFVTSGDTVTLSFTADESINTPTVSIAGDTSSVTIANTSGNNWTAQYTIPNGIALGSVDFTIDFQDTAGNTAAQISSTTDNTFLAVDNASPTGYENGKIVYVADNLRDMYFLNSFDDDSPTKYLHLIWI